MWKCLHITFGNFEPGDTLWWDSSISSYCKFCHGCSPVQRQRAPSTHVCCYELNRRAGRCSCGIESSSFLCCGFDLDLDCLCSCVSVSRGFVSSKVCTVRMLFSPTHTCKSILCSFLSLVMSSPKISYSRWPCEWIRIVSIERSNCVWPLNTGVRLSKSARAQSTKFSVKVLGSPNSQIASTGIYFCIDKKIVIV